MVRPLQRNDAIIKGKICAIIPYYTLLYPATSLICQMNSIYAWLNWKSGFPIYAYQLPYVHDVGIRDAWAFSTTR